MNTDKQFVVYKTCWAPVTSYMGKAVGEWVFYLIIYNVTLVLYFRSNTFTFSLRICTNIKSNRF